MQVSSWVLAVVNQRAGCVENASWLTALWKLLKIKVCVGFEAKACPKVKLFVQITISFLSLEMCWKWLLNDLES